MSDRTRISDRLAIFFRSFLIQAAWNYQTLLGMGFCFCVIPLARRLCKTQRERSEFLKRHLVFFNSHPYFATYCLGAVTKLEEEAADNPNPDTGVISQLKDGLTGPLGSQGDQMFWSYIKPISLTVGMCFGLLLGWIAVPLFLIIYNIPHLYVRIKGWRQSYRMGFDIVYVLAKKHVGKIDHVLSIIGLSLSGVLIAIASHWSIQQNTAVFVSFLVSVLVSAVLLKLKQSAKVILTTAIITSLIIGAVYTL